ncbi:MAG TPA: ClpXP protease specificity-enhancing factor SspB [Polyangia bacterium]|nr:ClpXP protease specificity-enhancing factor SspB [Polyangia bacterium]
MHLDARRPGVVVPLHLRAEGHLVLQYGHDLPIPIPDLEIDEYGVRATLSFAKTPHRTVVPWSAVYVVACDDGRGVLYHEDVPEDVSIVAARTGGTPDDLADLEPAPVGEIPAGVNGPSGRITERTLHSVPADAGSVEDEPTAAGRRRRKPQLRLVK